METYQYSKSQKLFSRASEIIPCGIYGHLGPAEACMIPVSAFPFYVDHAKGSHFWDIDGNNFIDYMCAYGPNVLGYADPDVEAAARKQAEIGNCTTLASPKMVELAELLVDTIESAEWAFFAKNGGDVTNLAMLTARAATGRKMIIKFNGGYHGVAPWMTALGYPGVIEEDMCNVISVPFNDLEAVRRAIEENPGNVACVIGTPYHHPAFGDNEMPVEGFWKGVRELCDKNGIVLIFDDVRCGFRLDMKGSDHHFGIKADLSCYCKALANGYNISALVGRQELKSAVGSVFYTGSYWLSAVPMAAAVACIHKMRELNAAELMLNLGKKFEQVMCAAAEAEGFRLHFSGASSMPFMRLEDDPNHSIHQAFIAECVRRGAFFANHHNNFINCALSEEDIRHTGEIAAEAFRAVKKDHADLLK